eukprot:CAMPEP_0174240062 /NCGR_PEP_ID=MMETSP0417-20130205/17275_1 /TAXON_ID=242541 /ORGANISM="Mayorella sp, Strain BSH-02190019" /LENGTH=296 /DNA_ID=CAMNT_0015319089 /DNA_START=159 /DNA_END=1046 /DNA_ORIENTATION=+
MGQGVAKLRTAEVNALVENTIFTEEEIYILYDRFQKVSALSLADSVIDREEFQESLGYRDSVFVNRIFSAFDLDGDDVIDFGEFVSGFSILCSNDMEKKTRWTFELYDVDSDGRIDKEELYGMLRSILHTNYLVSLSEKEIRELVDRTFREVDADGDGTIDFEEYRSLVKKYPDIVRNLTIDRNLILEAGEEAASPLYAASPRGSDRLHSPRTPRGSSNLREQRMRGYMSFSLPSFKFGKLVSSPRRPTSPERASLGTSPPASAQATRAQSSINLLHSYPRNSKPRGASTTTETER